MPLVKRNIEPRHLCHGTVPDGIGNELECVTNNTLSAIIRQLSCLISLQDINMRKAFKSSTLQDQQVLSKDSIPNSVSEMHSSSDVPPPLSTLTAFREDSTDAMKFYSDPSYFFDLWKEKMLQDTEDKRKERRRQREQKRCMESATLQREVKKVRKARNRRQEWNVMALDKELRPDHRHPQTLRRGASSEGSFSPDGRPDLPDYPLPPVPTHAAYNYVSGNTHSSSPVEHEYHSIDVNYKRVAYATAETHATDRINGPRCPLVDYNSCSPLPGSGPPIPSAQTVFGFPLDTLPPAPHNGGGPGYPMTPVPPSGSGPRTLPPPPGPPPPLLPPPAVPSHPGGGKSETNPVRDARSDLLSAIRIGIQLRKVQEQQEQQNKQEPVGNDVATILSRRIAVEYSDSEDDSELDENEWSD
ncbi:actin-binding protein WASF3-like isoform X2 [Antennarius striatus]|uniref:actin-binding protein WASF3-like isoform X2 n=1 Tax=Antennarius striatus TaxID=241820 RepID=UPI0035B088A4